MLTQRVTIFMVCFFVMGHYTAALPGRISGEFAPALALTSVYCNKKPAIHPMNPAFGMHFGAAYHFSLQEHCALSIGLSYAWSYIDLRRIASNPIPDIHEVHVLRAIWIPILGRFYTSELKIDTSICFKVGVIPTIFLPTRLKELKAAQAFFTKAQDKPLGCFLLLGTGIKYDFSPSNSLVIGISFCGDIVGIMNRQDTHSGEVHCHHNFICLDCCLLF